ESEASDFQAQTESSRAQLANTDKEIQDIDRTIASKTTSEQIGNALNELGELLNTYDPTQAATLAEEIAELNEKIDTTQATKIFLNHLENLPISTQQQLLSLLQISTKELTELTHKRKQFVQDSIDAEQNLQLIEEQRPYLKIVESNMQAIKKNKEILITKDAAAQTAAEKLSNTKTFADVNRIAEELTLARRGIYDQQDTQGAYSEQETQARIFFRLGVAKTAQAQLPTELEQVLNSINQERQVQYNLEKLAAQYGSFITVIGPFIPLMALQNLQIGLPGQSSKFSFWQNVKGTLSNLKNPFNLIFGLGTILRISLGSAPVPHGGLSINPSEEYYEKGIAGIMKQVATPQGASLAALYYIKELSDELGDKIVSRLPKVVINSRGEEVPIEAISPEEKATLLAKNLPQIGVLYAQLFGNIQKDPHPEAVIAGLIKNIDENPAFKELLAIILSGTSSGDNYKSLKQAIKQDVANAIGETGKAFAQRLLSNEEKTLEFEKLFNTVINSIIQRAFPQLKTSLPVQIPGFTNPI
ncbi:MAG: hypothetical protein Q7K43_05655, partial [Candidatus Woesearchaeota archaeon]|nr:hypothetical protein [Candidatus Woesearchaeota archaeon]